MGSFFSCTSRRDGNGSYAFARRRRRRQRIRFVCGQRSNSLSLIDQLVLETLKELKNFGLDQSDSRAAPASMLQLSDHADDGEGWVQVLLSMVNVVPPEDSLGSSLIIAVIDNCPLPDKETITQLSQMLDLCNKSTKHTTVYQHQNICVILGTLAVKLPGPASIALLTEDTLAYLFNNMDLEVNPSIILYSLFALEKFAQIRENRHTIEQFKNSELSTTLLVLEKLTNSFRPLYAQIGFCAEWLLDNIFVNNLRTLTYLNVSMEGVNVILNYKCASEYLKIGPSGLEARSDSCCFESVRCTFQIDEGTWYYEVTVLTSGIMQIGWSTRKTKFLNLEGFGVGDDEYSIAYDGCRQLLWYGGQNTSCLSGRAWQVGDTVGCLLQLENPFPVAKFYLNGQIVGSNEKIFQRAMSEYFAAASFMSFQQCSFNFGSKPFKHPPKSVTFNVMNDHGKLDEKEKAILPKKIILEQLGEPTADEDSCTICFDLKADVTLEPCKHEGYCKLCVQKLTSCPICRQSINNNHQEETIQQPPATTTTALMSEQ